MRRFYRTIIINGERDRVPLWNGDGVAFIITPLASFPMSPCTHRKKDSRNSSHTDTTAFFPFSVAPCGNCVMCDDPHLPQVTGILGDIEIPPEEMSPHERTEIHALIPLTFSRFPEHTSTVPFEWFIIIIKLSKTQSPVHAGIEKKASLTGSILQKHRFRFNRRTFKTFWVLWAETPRYLFYKRTKSDRNIIHHFLFQSFYGNDVYSECKILCTLRTKKKIFQHSKRICMFGV